MSNYYSIAKNPHTKRWEPAEFMDDYFDKHKYGVRFRNNPDGNNLVVGIENVQCADTTRSATFSDIHAAFIDFCEKYDRNMSNDQAAAEFFNCLEEAQNNGR